MYIIMYIYIYHIIVSIYTYIYIYIYIRIYIYIHILYLYIYVNKYILVRFNTVLCVYIYTYIYNYIYICKHIHTCRNMGYCVFWISNPHSIFNVSRGLSAPPRDIIPCLCHSRWSQRLAMWLWTHGDLMGFNGILSWLIGSNGCLLI